MCHVRPPSDFEVYGWIRHHLIFSFVCIRHNYRNSCPIGDKRYQAVKSYRNQWRNNGVCFFFLEDSEKKTHKNHKASLWEGWCWACHPWTARSRLLFLWSQGGPRVVSTKWHEKSKDQTVEALKSQLLDQPLWLSATTAISLSPVVLYPTVKSNGYAKWIISFPRETLVYSQYVVSTWYLSLPQAKSQRT